MNFIHFVLVTPTTAVIIVGAGPTGLALALDLQRRGVSFCLLEKLLAPMPFSKANTLMSRTLEEFDRLGVVEQMLASGVMLPGARIFQDRRQIAEFKVEMAQTSMPFMLNLRQSQLEDILRRKLEAQGGTIQRGWELQDVAQYETELSAQFVHTSGERRTLRAQYLVGTDGAHSRVRRLLALPLAGTTYPEPFLVADVHADIQLARDSTYCWLREDGFLLGWPHREANYWHFVMNLTAAQQATSPDLAQLQGWVRERSACADINLYDATWISKFRIHNRSVRKYRVGRIMVIGDAAHLHSPMAGKGLGNSAQEAFNLGWKLAAVVNGTAHAALLDTVEQERLPVLRSVMRESNLSHRMFLGGTRLVRLFRDHAFPRLVTLKPLERRVSAGNAQLDIRYRDSSLSAQHADTLWTRCSLAWRRGPQAGDRAPDASLERDDGRPVRVHEFYRHTGWTLLIFRDHADLPRIQQICRVAHDFSANIQVLEIGRDAQLRDPQGQAVRRYGANAACVYLVRPDGYIGFRSQSVRPDLLAHYLEQVLLPDRGSPPAQPPARGQVQP